MNPTDTPEPKPAPKGIPLYVPSWRKDRFEFVKAYVLARATAYSRGDILVSYKDEVIWNANALYDAIVKDMTCK